MQEHIIFVTNANISLLENLVHEKATFGQEPVAFVMKDTMRI